MDTNVCRLCRSWPSDTSDGLCDICATEADRTGRIACEHAAIRGVVSSYIDGQVTAHEAVTYIVAVLITGNPHE